MKIKITFKPLRNLAGKPVRIINKKMRTVARPVSKLNRVIWRGCRIHLGSWESFHEMLHRRATAPFHFSLPGPKAGKA